jgi:VanZ family protein
MRFGGNSLGVRVSCNLGYASALVWMAVVPHVPLQRAGISDVHAHSAAYGLQAALLIWATYEVAQPLISAAVAWLGATALGLTTEVLQSLQPARATEVSDLLADVFGTTLVVAGYLMVRRVSAVLRVAASARRTGARIRGGPT